MIGPLYEAALVEGGLLELEHATSPRAAAPAVTVRPAPGASEPHDPRCVVSSGAGEPRDPSCVAPPGGPDGVRPDVVSAPGGGPARATRGAGEMREVVPVDRWFREVPGDASLLDRCAGPVLDIGSGPGRLTVALAGRGMVALGIDVAGAAVDMTRRAGAAALCRDVFAAVPGEGRWRTALLADGNIGIGGDPVALLFRVAELLHPYGRALVELEPPGRGIRRSRVRLRRGDRYGDWFDWAYAGVDDIAELSAGAGLSVSGTWTSGGRWFACLAREVPCA